MQSDGRPVLGLLIVGVVVVAAALLLLGLGVAVGTGLLVGLLLGLAAVAAAMVVARRNPSAGWSGSLVPKDENAGPGLLLEFGHAITRVADVDSGALSQVIPIAREATANGVRLEAIAAELRTDGGIVSLVSHVRPPVAPPGHFAELQVTDDAGTEYVAAVQGSGGSSPSTSRYDLRFSPAPPPTATELRIEISRFMDPFPESPSAPVEGPWSFTVAIPSHASTNKQSASPDD
ncbi:MAG TPA: hypothetical protein VLB67_02035 [Acidimicrobiia bacterium]|nr:hypothetical protein [Acidimicrobiia bacterium]